jgi:hypothetical protein
MVDVVGIDADVLIVLALLGEAGIVPSNESWL